MNNPKHTKGPWIVDATASSGSNRYAIGPKGKDTVASLNLATTRCPATNAANARLIAAAPETKEIKDEAIEALKLLIEWCKDKRNYRAPGCDEQRAEAWKRARAIVERDAKATGGAE